MSSQKQKKICTENLAEKAPEEDFELVELELDEADIVRYIGDEKGNTIGFVLLEDGKEVEYLYLDEDEAKAISDSENTSTPETDVSTADENTLGITQEGMKEAVGDMKEIYRAGTALGAELKGAFDDIKHSLDFLK